MTTSPYGNSSSIHAVVLWAATGILAATVLWIVTLPAWEGEPILASSMFDSLTVFTSAVCAGTILVRHADMGIDRPTLFHIPFIYSAVTYAYRVAQVIFGNQTYIARSVEYALLDVFNASVFSATVLLATLVNTGMVRCSWDGWATSSLAIVFALSEISMHPILFAIQATYQAPTLFAAGVISSIALLTTAQITWVKMKGIRAYRSSVLIAGFLMLVLSWGHTVFNTLHAGASWSLSPVLRLIGMQLVFMSGALPHLRMAGWGKRPTLIYVVILSSVVILPAATAAVTTWAIHGSILPQYQTYALIHAGAAVLSSSMSVLVIFYDKGRFSGARYPIAASLTSWSVVETVQVITAISARTIVDADSALRNQLVGAVTTLLLLSLALRWIVTPPPEGSRKKLRLMHIGVIGGTLAGIGILKVIHDATLAVIGSATLTNAVRVTIVVIVLFIAFVYAYLDLVAASATRGRVTIDLFAVRFIIVWVVPSLVKAICPHTSAGWWVAEVVLFAGLLIGPVIMGHFYIIEINEREAHARRAALYADLLMHDISNYHQALSLSLGLIESGKLGEAEVRNVLKSANECLARADDIILNVRRIGAISSAEGSALVVTDIVEVAQEALRTVATRNAGQEIKLEINRKPGECFTMASPLLLDVFLILLSGAAEGVGEPIINIEITPRKTASRSLWDVSLTDYRGRSEQPDRPIALGENMNGGVSLGFYVASLLVESFGGELSVRNIVPDRSSAGTVYLLRLPRVENPRQDRGAR
ncbi:MAG: hypothetical protein QXS20_04685 [Candidatus Thorarchaeota archaeon]